jgi:hypothetical protein
VKGSLRVVIVAILAVMLCAVMAPVAAATTWDVSKPFGSVVGQVQTSGSTTFVVTDKSGKKIGKVVKASSGGWKVVRGSKRIASVKGGNAKYPANLYDLKGKHVGKCGRASDSWQLIQIQTIAVSTKAPATPLNVVLITVATVPKACPARAALGAARLLNWQ